MRDIADIVEFMIHEFMDLYIPIHFNGWVFNIDLWRLIVAFVVLGVIGHIIISRFNKLMEG